MIQRTFGAIMLLVVLAFVQDARATQSPPSTPTNPILFVTQVPVPADFTTIGSAFGNHLSDPNSAVRGGDLYIRYPDGTLKNLTAAAGFGSAGAQQDANSIAVRDPSVHWSGTKALFSMVIGAPLHQFDISFNGFWQIYEITGFGEGETPVITKVPNQPTGFNNVSPCYGTDERIIFTSDQPRNGAGYLYPQHDEYEFAPSITGIWSLDPGTGNLFLMSHDPSGSFSPTIDSFGRVIFSRWDHLQRDQEADIDALSTTGPVYGTMNFSDESASAQQLPRQEEVFPEPRSDRTDLLAGTNLIGHEFNQFFPWMINEDGTAEETINHVGRHELFNYMAPVFNDDPNLLYFSPSPSRVNQNQIENMLQIREDPTQPGVYYGIDCPEFSTHAAGQIITLFGPAGMDADNMYVTYITPRSTQSYNLDGSPTDPTDTGHYRNPLPLSDGLLIGVHAPETRADDNDGTTANPTTRYAFRLKTIAASGQYYAAGQTLTPGISKTITYWSPDVLVTYSGPLWELDPAEVYVRTKPVATPAPLPTPEQNVFDEEGVDTATFQGYMKSNGLALIVSRNLTTRDAADKQQPYNLRVTGTTTETIPTSGKIYDISYLQLFQADQLRGYTGGGTVVRPGRRVLATPLHDTLSNNPANPNGPVGSVQIASDGSMAAFVPANRAMTWATTDATGTPVVRERYWLSFQPGEIRSCTSCHGINTKDQAGNPAPVNEPEALHTLLQAYKTAIGPNPPPVLTSGPGAAPNPAQSGQSVTLTAATSGTAPLTYTWDFGDGSPQGAGASVHHAYSAVGQYTVGVTVTDGNGKATSGSIQVTVVVPNSVPVLTNGPSATPNPVQPAQSVAFSAAATGTPTLSYSWNFGDNSPTATGASVNHTYAAVGQYTATVTVTDGNSMTTSATVQVNVNANTTGALTVQSAILKFDFKKNGMDTFALNGSVQLAGNASLAGQTGVITLGSYSQTINLNARGNTVLQVHGPGKKSAALAAWRVSVNIKKASLFAAMGIQALANANVKPPVQVNVPVTVTVGTNSFQTTLALSYTAKAGKTGLGVGK